MSEYSSQISWNRSEDETFTDQKYSRGHKWNFDGGATVPASSSPHIVPLPYSVEANVDPEEAFIASLSSCHMLFFLAFAAKRKFVVDEYTDHALGYIEKDATGKSLMSKVRLRPKVKFSGEKIPNANDLQKLHDEAHHHCFLANSVTSEIIIDIE